MALHKARNAVIHTCIFTFLLVKTKVVWTNTYSTKEKTEGMSGCLWVDISVSFPERIGRWRMCVSATECYTWSHFTNSYYERDDDSGFWQKRICLWLQIDIPVEKYTLKTNRTHELDCNPIVPWRTWTTTTNKQIKKSLKQNKTTKTTTNKNFK